MEKKFEKINNLINFCLYLWIFLLPWQTRLILQPRYLNGEFWEYGSVSFYATEALLLFILLLFLFKLVGEKKLGVLIKKFLQSLLELRINLTKIIVLLLFWGALSLLWTSDVTATASRSGHLFLVVAAAVIIFQQKLNWRRIVLLIIAAAVGQSILAINQFLEQKILASTLLGIAEQTPARLGASVIQAGAVRWLRAYGGLPHPNIFGGWLVFAIIFLLQQILRAHNILPQAKFEDKKRIKIFLFGLYGSLIFVVSGWVLSFSRASWLALSLAVIIYGIYIIHINRKSLVLFLRGILVIVVTVLVWFTIYPTPFITRLAGREVLEKQSFVERQLSYHDSKSMLQVSFWQGLGLGAYTKILAQDFPQRPMSLNQPVHNSVLLVLAELGIVGLVLFVGLIFFVYKKSTDKFVATLLLTTVILLMQFDHWWVSLVFGNYFFALLLIIILLKSREKLVF